MSAVQSKKPVESMTAREVIAALVRQGLTPMRIGVALDVHLNSVNRWWKKGVKPHPSHIRRLRDLLKDQAAGNTNDTKH